MEQQTHTQFLMNNRSNSTYIELETIDSNPTNRNYSIYIGIIFKYLICYEHNKRLLANITNHISYINFLHSFIFCIHHESNYIYEHLLQLQLFTLKF